MKTKRLENLLGQRERLQRAIQVFDAISGSPFHTNPFHLERNKLDIEIETLERAIREEKPLNSD